MESNINKLAEGEIVNLFDVQLEYVHVYEAEKHPDGERLAFSLAAFVDDRTAVKLRNGELTAIKKDANLVNLRTNFRPRVHVLEPEIKEFIETLQIADAFNIPRDKLLEGCRANVTGRVYEAHYKGKLYRGLTLLNVHILNPDKLRQLVVH